MGACVTRQDVPLHGGGERNRLPEGKAQAIAGYGIHAAGSVSNQRDVTRMYGAKRVHLGDCAAFSAGKLRAGEALLQLRAVTQHRIEVGVWHAHGHHHDTNFLAADRSYVGLGAMSPINLHMIRPRAQAVVAPRGVSSILPGRGIQTAPTANPRAAAIGADNPAQQSFRASNPHRRPCQSAALCHPRRRPTSLADAPLWQPQDPLALPQSRTRLLLIYRRPLPAPIPVLFILRSDLCRLDFRHSRRGEPGRALRSRRPLKCGPVPQHCGWRPRIRSAALPSPPTAAPLSAP